MIEVKPENAAEVARRVKAGELPGPAKSLAEAVCRVMEQVGYVQKDKQMQGGGSYKYVSIEAVLEKLRPEMLRHGLIMLPVGLEAMTLEVVEGKNSRQNRTQVRYTFDLIHHPSGETKPVVVIGEGMDVGDKSSNKAMTAARKAAMVMAFNIETGTDPDDTPSREQERAEPRQPLKDELIRNAGLAPSRNPLEILWRETQEHEKSGRLSAFDAEEVYAVIKRESRKFPKPPEPQQKPTQPAGKGV